MPGRKKKNTLRLGVGAVGMVLVNKLHSKPYIARVKKNILVMDRIEDAIVVSREMKMVNRKNQPCLVLKHPDFEQDVYCVLKWFKITAEGNGNDFFDQPTEEEGEDDNNDNIEDEAGPPAPPELVTAIQQSAEGQPLVEEEIEALRAQGIAVDDDNEPLPENVRPAGQQTQTPSIMKGWGKPTICPRRAGGYDKTKPRMKERKFNTREEVELDMLDYFEAMIPKEYFINTVLPATNKTLGDKPTLTYGEFL